MNKLDSGRECLDSRASGQLHLSARRAEASPARAEEKHGRENPGKPHGYFPYKLFVINGLDTHGWHGSCPIPVMAKQLIASHLRRIGMCLDLRRRAGGWHSAACEDPTGGIHPPQ